MVRLFLSLCLAFSFAVSTSAQDADTLKVGDEAPNWTLTGSDGKVYSLADYKGKQAVVVAWYPMALTGG